jgi:hypothetical protein
MTLKSKSILMTNCDTKWSETTSFFLAEVKFNKYFEQILIMLQEYGKELETWNTNRKY